MGCKMLCTWHLVPGIQRSSHRLITAIPPGSRCPLSWHGRDLGEVATLLEVVNHDAACSAILAILSLQAPRA